MNKTHTLRDFVYLFDNDFSDVKEWQDQYFKVIREETLFLSLYGQLAAHIVRKVT